MIPNPFLEITEAFDRVINLIVEERNPYMAKGTFIKYYKCADVSYVQCGGQKKKLYGRHSLFNPSLLTEGDKIEVDTRHLIDF